MQVARAFFLRAPNEFNLVFSLHKRIFSRKVYFTNRDCVQRHNISFLNDRYLKLKFAEYHTITYTATQHNKLSRVEGKFHMSIVTIATPFQAALPMGQAFFSSAFAVARPLFGAGALMTFVMMFKPLITGVLQAIRLVFNPRLSLEERNSRRTLRGVLLLNRMARDLDQSHPSQAAELRMLASRG